MKYEFITTDKQLYKSSLSTKKCILDLTMYTTNFIPDSLFEANESIISVILNFHQKIIGKKSFQNCSKLKTFDGQIYTIGDKSFKGTTNLEYFNFSEIVLLGEEAFENSGLKKISLSKLKIISKSAFKNCFFLKECHLDGVEEIQETAFSACNLTKVVFPEQLQEISDRAFDLNPMLSTLVFLGDTPPKISKSAFENCCIQNIWIFENKDLYLKQFPKKLHNKINLIENPKDLRELLI